MNLEVVANANGSTPTAQVVVESTDQPSTNGVKLFEVTVVAEVQLTLSGRANVYAADSDQAVEKVQAQIDAEALDDDLELEDYESGRTMPYADVKHISNVDFQVDGVALVEDNLDPADVLGAEVKELQASISWNTDALAKHKAFLEALLNEGDDEQAVAA